MLTGRNNLNANRLHLFVKEKHRALAKQAAENAVRVSKGESPLGQAKAGPSRPG